MREVDPPVLGFVSPDVAAVSRRIALAEAWERTRASYGLEARPWASWSGRRFAPRTDLAAWHIDYGVQKSAVRRVENPIVPPNGGRALADYLARPRQHAKTAPALLVQDAVVRSAQRREPFAPGTLSDPEKLIAFVRSMDVPLEPWQADVIRGWYS